ncbi:putative transmembrane protein [Halotydeus destructor]|nr:putative transmembrane protein [Halotydeus destructor]
MDDISSYVKFLFPVFVSAIWGLSTPFLRKQSKGIENVRDPNRNWFYNFYKELRFLVTNYKYLAAFLTNQLGSILFVFALGMFDLSLVVPLVNSMTFIFVFIGDLLLHEAKLDKLTFSGVFLIASGIAVSLYSK